MLPRRAKSPDRYVRPVHPWPETRCFRPVFSPVAPSGLALQRLAGAGHGDPGASTRDCRLAIRPRGVMDILRARAKVTSAFGRRSMLARSLACRVNTSPYSPFPLLARQVPRRPRRYELIFARASGPVPGVTAGFGSSSKPVQGRPGPRPGEPSARGALRRADGGRSRAEG
jgi:hypothetical protein